MDRALRLVACAPLASFRPMKGKQAPSSRSKIEAASTVLFVERRLESIADFFTGDYRVHLTEDDMSGGHDLVRRSLNALFRAFPALSIHVEILAEQSDRVVWQRTLRGIQQGAVQGFPACGQEIVWRDMVVSHFRDGLIAEEWIVSEFIERLLLARKRA